MRHYGGPYGGWDSPPNSFPSGPPTDYQYAAGPPNYPPQPPSGPPQSSWEGPPNTYPAPSHTDYSPASFTPWTSQPDTQPPSVDPEAALKFIKRYTSRKNGADRPGGRLWNPDEVKYAENRLSDTFSVSPIKFRRPTFKSSNITQSGQTSIDTFIDTLSTNIGQYQGPSSKEVYGRLRQYLRNTPNYEGPMTKKQRREKEKAKSSTRDTDDTNSESSRTRESSRSGRSDSERGSSSRSSSGRERSSSRGRSKSRSHKDSSGSERSSSGRSSKSSSKDRDRKKRHGSREKSKHKSRGRSSSKSRSSRDSKSHRSENKSKPSSKSKSSSSSRSKNGKSRSSRDDKRRRKSSRKRKSSSDRHKKRSRSSSSTSRKSSEPSSHGSSTESAASAEADWIPSELDSLQSGPPTEGAPSRKSRKSKSEKRDERRARTKARDKEKRREKRASRKSERSESGTSNNRRRGGKRQREKRKQRKEEEGSRTSSISGDESDLNDDLGYDIDTLTIPDTNSTEPAQTTEDQVKALVDQIMKQKQVTDLTANMPSTAKPDPGWIEALLKLPEGQKFLANTILGSTSPPAQTPETVTTTYESPNGGRKVVKESIDKQGVKTRIVQEKGWEEPSTSLLSAF